MPNCVKIDNFFKPCDLEIWWITFKNNTAPLLCYFKLSAAFRSHWWIQTELQSGNAQLCKNRRFFFSRVTLKFDRWPWKNNRAPLLCYINLCASFSSHWWIQTWVTVTKHPIWVKINDIFSRVTFKHDGWPWKTIVHLFYATSSFVHHFVPIGEFKLELQSGNAQFGSKSTIFFSRLTFKLDGWPWKTIGHLFYDTLSFVYHLNAIGQFKLKLQSGNAQFGSKSTIYLAVWPWNLTDDLEKQ